MNRFSKSPAPTRPGRPIALVVLLLLVTSCRAGDPPVPWNQSDIVRDLTAELRRYERLEGDLTQVEVLAWRTQIRESKLAEFPPSASVPAPVQRTRSDSVLLCARVKTAANSTWMLIHAYRRPDQENRWRRALINRELRSPPPPLWPGETPDGTWHGIQRFSHAPTSDEICHFAEVAFLNSMAPEWRTVSGALQTATWIRTTGAKPRCELVW